MTESVNTTSPADDDDDVFEESSDEFASKFDLRDRLVMIYPTGKSGKRPSDNGGDPYEWYETYTVVLDDGPDGYQARVKTDEGDRPNRVPSVAEEGPQVLRNFQWSAGGFRIRLEGKVPSKNKGVPVGLLGRVNEKPIKGKTPAWRPNPPTEADRARAVEPEVKAIRLEARDEIVAALKAAEAEDAF